MSAIDRIFDPRFLQGYWPLNRDAEDYSGHGRHGTPTDLTFVKGPFNGKDVGDFNGTSGLVSVSDSAALSPSTISVCAWVQGDTVVTEGIVTKRDAYNVNNAFGLAIDGSSKFVFNGTTNGTTLVAATSSKAVVPDNPYFVCGTFDEFFDIRLFVNGIFEKKNSLAGGLFDSTAPILIGGVNSSSILYANIKCWDVRVYNVALTAEEIAALYSLKQ